MLWWVVLIGVLKADLPTRCYQSDLSNTRWTFGITADVDGDLCGTPVPADVSSFQEWSTISLADPDQEVTWTLQSDNIVKNSRPIGTWTMVQASGFLLHVWNTYISFQFALGDDCERTVITFFRNGSDTFCAQGLRRDRSLYRPRSQRHNEVELPPSSPVVRSFSWASTLPMPRISSQSCGSCYAVAVGGFVTLRLALQLLTADPWRTDFPSVDLQPLIDCMPRAQACKGGTGVDALMYLFEIGYPLTCSRCGCFGHDRVSVRDIRYIGGSLGAASSTELKEALTQRGPLMVSIYALGKPATKTWSGDPFDLNHAMVLVGYRELENGRDEWQVWEPPNLFQWLPTSVGILAAPLEAEPVLTSQS